MNTDCLEEFNCFPTAKKKVPNCITQEKCKEYRYSDLMRTCVYLGTDCGRYTCHRDGGPKPKVEEQNDKPKPCDWQEPKESTAQKIVQYAKDNPPPPPQRGSILDEAKAIINGERNDMYGNPEDSFMLIAELWTAFLGVTISAKDVALMMCLLKIARETKQGSRDNWRDLAGYAALGADMEGK